MKFGYYADNEIPKSIADKEEYRKEYTTLNSHGYRCPEFSPLPNGGKNVVVLGCSHTFGEGLSDSQVWVRRLEKLLDNNRLRFWNLGHPGASPDLCVRILYGSEKVIFPKIIIVCWPAWSRRERLEQDPTSLTSDNPLLKQENEHTDRNNFLKCVFQTEKFAQHTQAKIFHCFAEAIYLIPKQNLNRRLETEYYNVLYQTSIKNCWPVWDKHLGKDARRTLITTPSLARDGIHYGVEHHETFATHFFETFKKNLK